MSITMFNENKVHLRSFKLMPILTDYKKTGLRSFVANSDLDYKIERAVDILREDRDVSLNTLVSEDLSFVRLENKPTGVMDIGDGTYGSRYQFTMIVDEETISGGLFRVLIRGYTSALDLSNNHGGRFSRAIPPTTLFYIDSIMSMTYQTDLSRRKFILNSKADTDNVLSHNGGDGFLTMLRPTDVMLNNYIREEDGGGYVLNKTNQLAGNGNHLSTIDNNSPFLYTKTCMNSLSNGICQDELSYGYEEISSKKNILKDSVRSMRERTIANNRILRRLFRITNSSKVSVLTVRDLMDVFNAHTLDGIAEVLTYDASDVRESELDLRDVDMMGMDTITVGVHEMYNSLQPLVSNSSLTDVSMIMCVDYSNVMGEYDVNITNYNSFLDNEADVRNKVLAFKNLVKRILLPSLDKYFKFDEEVMKYGGYVIIVNYRFFLDTIIDVKIGNEEIRYRLPNFAGSQLSPVITNKNSDFSINPLSNIMDNVTSNVIEFN